MSSARHPVRRPAAIGAWTAAFGRLRLQWPWTACLVALLLVAAPTKGHTTLMEGSYNIIGSCTAEECSNGPFTFSGMFDIAADNSVQNFMMSFDVLNAFEFTAFNLNNSDTGSQMLLGRVQTASRNSLFFDGDGQWVCTPDEGCNISPNLRLDEVDGGTYEVVRKSVAEPPTVALFAFGLILIVWLARRWRAGSSAVRSARLVPGGSRT